MQRSYQRLQAEDIQHVLIHKFSVKVKVIFCVGYESIVETGGTDPFILFFFAPDMASGQIHSLAVLLRFNCPMELTGTKHVYILHFGWFIKSEHGQHYIRQK